MVAHLVAGREEVAHPALGDDHAVSRERSEGVGLLGAGGRGLLGGGKGGAVHGVRDAAPGGCLLGGEPYIFT